jgi:hypothetical protein
MAKSEAFAVRTKKSGVKKYPVKVTTELQDIQIRRGFK